MTYTDEQIQAMSIDDLADLAEAIANWPAALEALTELRRFALTLADPERRTMLSCISALHELEMTDAEVRSVLRALIVAHGQRVAESDWEPDLLAMADDIAFHEEVLANTVRSWNRSGRHSWSDIGRIFAITQQSAWHKWARKDQ